jgi:CBS domain-containing protein
MLVKEIMTTNVKTVSKDMGIHELAQFFIDNGISGAPIADADGSYAGLVLAEGLIYQDKKVHLPSFLALTVGFMPFGTADLEEEIKRISGTKVSDIAEKNVVILTPETSVEDVATIMVEKGKHYFPVMDHLKLVGVLTKKDLVRAIAQKKIH